MILSKKPFDLSNFQCNDITSLHVFCEQDFSGSVLCAQIQPLPSSSSLTHLSFLKQNIEESALVALSSAVVQGRLSNVSHLAFVHCNGLAGTFPLLFSSIWPKLSHLNLRGSKLDTDVQVVIDRQSDFLPNLTMLVLGDFSHGSCQLSRPWLNLTSLFLDNELDDERGFIEAINQGLLPNLSSLGLSLLVNASRLKLRLNHLLLLTSLVLNRYIAHVSDLVIPVNDGHNLRLHKLDISHSSFITGDLSVLLRHSFPSLNSLILSNCGLISQDLRSLAQASVQGRLPVLRHLDISENLIICLDDMFDASCAWNQLLKLNVRKTGGSGNALSRQNECPSSDRLQSLLELTISEDHILHLGISWQMLQKLCIRESILLSQIANAVEKRIFPVLHSICLQFNPIPFKQNRKLSDDAIIIRLLQANISVHEAVSPHDPFTSEFCLCQMDN